LLPGIESENSRNDSQQQAVSLRARPASCQQMCTVASCPEDTQKSRHGSQQPQQATASLQVGHSRQDDVCRRMPKKLGAVLGKNIWGGGGLAPHHLGGNNG